MSRERRERMSREFERRFGGTPELWGRAPGRVDLMGSHTDYNDGFVLTMPIDLDTWICLSPRRGERAHVVTMDLGEEGEFSVREPDYASMPQWLRYVAGVVSSMSDAGHRVPSFNAVIQSTVPLGGGLSSSAALEASVAVTLAALGGIRMERTEMALLCQRAENRYAGMNCGILDQYTSVLGEEGLLILLDCRALSHRAVHPPAGISVVVCDTHAPHELTGTEYGTRRSQCEAGVQALAQFYPGVRALRDVTLEQLLSHVDALDQVVARRCRFVVEENQRVLEMAEALERDDRSAMARLNRESFAGARDLYEISVPEMEAMVEAILASAGAIGARQAGAGFGGCMTALVESSRVPAFMEEAASRYERATGYHPDLYLVQAGAGAELMR